MEAESLSNKLKQSLHDLRAESLAVIALFIGVGDAAREASLARTHQPQNDPTN